MNENFVETFLKTRGDIKRKYHLIKQKSISMDFDNPHIIIPDKTQNKHQKFISTADCVNSKILVSTDETKQNKLSFTIRRNITNESFKNVFKKSPDLDKVNMKDLFKFSNKKFEDGEEDLKRVSLTDFLDLSRSKSTPYITVAKFSSSNKNSSGIREASEEDEEEKIQSKKFKEDMEYSPKSSKKPSGEKLSEIKKTQKIDKMLQESIADSGSSCSEDEEENLSLKNPSNRRRRVQVNQNLVESFGSCSSSNSDSESDEQEVQNLELVADNSSSSGASMCEESLKIKLIPEKKMKMKKTPGKKIDQKNQVTSSEDEGIRPRLNLLPEEDAGECLTIKKKLREKEKQKAVKKRSRHSSDTSVSFFRVNNQRLFEGLNFQDSSIQNLDLPQQVSKSPKNKKKMVKKASRSTQYLHEGSMENTTGQAYQIKRLMSISIQPSGARDLPDSDNKSEEETTLCIVCQQPLSNTQMVACFNICEHQFHEPCLFELIDQKEYKTVEEEEEREGESDFGDESRSGKFEPEPKDRNINALFCPKCHQF